MSKSSLTNFDIALAARVRLLLSQRSTVPLFGVEIVIFGQSTSKSASTQNKSDVVDYNYYGLACQSSDRTSK